jgi:hypothetical protein
MADHTEAAIKLVTELKQNKLLPKFNNELMDQVTKEITKTYIELSEKMQDPDFDREEEAEIAKPLVMS